MGSGIESTPNNMADNKRGNILTPSTGLVTSRPGKIEKNENSSGNEDFEIMGIKAS